MKKNLENLEEIFHKKIPLTKAMSLEVRSFDGQNLELFAPLKENLNHVNTAFGGSLYYLAVLTGWGMVYMIQQENNLDGDILIFDSNISYPKAIASNMKSICSITSKEKDIEKFVKTYKRRAIARITLEVNIFDENEVCGASFKGIYVLTK